MTTQERIWAATPADGVMKDETLYGWTTDEHLQAWIDEEDTDLNDPVVYVEYVRRDPAVLAELPEVQELADDLASCIAMIQHSIGVGKDVFIEPDTRKKLSDARTRLETFRAAAIREGGNG
jgi:hypothetical protein